MVITLVRRTQMPRALIRTQKLKGRGQLVNAF